MHARRLIISIIAISGAGAPAAAQEADAPGPQSAQPADPAEATDRPDSPDSAPEDADADRFELALEADLRAWYPAPGGRFFLPGETRGGRDIDVEDLNLDSPRIGPYPRLRGEAGDFWVSFTAARFETDRETSSPVTRPIGDIDINEGDALHTRMRYTTADALIGYRFLERSLFRTGEPESRLDLYLEAGLGARIDHFDIELQRRAGGRASADEAFAMALASVRARVNLPLDTSIGFAATFGANPGFGDQAAYASDFEATGGWRPAPNVELIAGYRISVIDMESGEGPEQFRYIGSYAGLFAGVTLRF